VFSAARNYAHLDSELGFVVLNGFLSCLIHAVAGTDCKSALLGFIPVKMNGCKLF
tara:strand:- start:4563 stop:4727 length:165 start_codon:yes stop_codon:yes gene_type:complete